MAESAAREEEEVDKESIIEQYVNITGSDKESAKHLLDAFIWNLESAVNMYLEGGSTVNNDKEDEISEILAASSSRSASTSTAANNAQNTNNRTSRKLQKPGSDPILIEDNPQSSLYEDTTPKPESVDVDDYVRAPIPQRQAVLVEDQYHALPYPQRRRQTTPRNVFDGFRDFRKETEEQEKLLRSGSATNSQSVAAHKMKRLHELFRPPVDILHHGDFQSARTQCTTKNRWLLVNVQNTMEFASQVLNRDVWSNKIVREILKENFILWQVYHDSNEGQHYGTFYKIHNYPHLAVIDPRTGERMVVWENLGMKPSANQFAELATLFLSENPSLNGELDKCEGEDEVDMKVTTDVDASTIIDRSEDAQLEAAIQASLEMKTTPKVISVLDDDVTDDDSDDNDDEDIEITDKHGSGSTNDRKRRKLNSESDQSEEKPSINACQSDEKPSNKIVSSANQNSATIKPDTNDTSNSTQGNNVAVERPSEERPVSDRPTTCKGGEKAKILLRTPTNERKQIVISFENTLEELAKEVSELGWSSSRYELVRSFPRQNLSSMNQQLTLKEVGLHKQETLFIQDR